MQFWTKILFGATALLFLAGSCSLTSDNADSSDSTSSSQALADIPSTTSSTAATTTAPNFSDTFATVSDGVFRVEATLCEQIQSQGTGFLVGPDLLLTAAHVTGTNQTARVIRSDGYESSAEVVAVDSDRDLALMTLSESVNGHEFAISDEGIRVGDEVGAIGHPSGLPLTFTSGRVSSLNYESGGVLFHQTDAPINPGNSGGPLINERGTVVGLVDWKFYEVEGISFVVTANEIRSFVEGPSANKVDIEFGCEGQDPPQQAWMSDPDLAEIPRMFAEYTELINSRLEGEAYDRFAGPRLLDVLPRDKFIEGNSTSSISELDVYYAFWDDDTVATAWVTFVSRQSSEFGPGGQTCSVWDLTYELVLDDEWKIEKATNEPGSPLTCD